MVPEDAMAMDPEDDHQLEVGQKVGAEAGVEAVLLPGKDVGREDADRKDMVRNDMGRKVVHHLM